MTATLLQAARPTARTVEWTPLLAVAGSLLAIGAMIRSMDESPGPMLWVGAAAMASAVVFGLRDPAAALLSALPTSRLARRLLRLGLLTAVALPLWLLVTESLPGNHDRALGPVVALAALGVAVATWLPVERNVAVAAAVPLIWAGTDQLLHGSLGILGDAAGWWRTDSLFITTVACAVVFLGRHR